VPKATSFCGVRERRSAPGCRREDHSCGAEHDLDDHLEVDQQGWRATSYRGLLKVHKGAENVKSFVRCDALMLDEISRSDTYPSIEIDGTR